MNKKTTFLIRDRYNEYLSWYFYLWAPVILISSVVILPIRGATLGNIFSLLSPLVVIIFSKYHTTFRYAWVLLFFFITYMLLCIFSQIGILSIGIPTFGQVILTDPTDKSIFLRTTLFSQSLYLFSCYQEHKFLIHLDKI